MLATIAASTFSRKCSIGGTSLSRNSEDAPQVFYQLRGEKTIAEFPQFGGVRLPVAAEIELSAEQCADEKKEDEFHEGKVAEKNIFG